MNLSRRNLVQLSLSGTALVLAQSLAGCLQAPAAAPNAIAPIGARRRDDTLIRLGGLGDGYKMTWAADDWQYFGVNDGTAWLDLPGTFSNSRMWRVGGSPATARFEPVKGYPELDKIARPDDAPSYYGHGVLAVDGRIFQFLATLDRRTETPRRWTGAKLVRSDDGGRTWRNRSGIGPVFWEDWDQQKDLIFFNEPNGAFSLISILQMGRDYADNRDGYVYLYSPNGSIDGQMNELVLARVPTTQIIDRTAYQFYAGQQEGRPQWSQDIAQRQAIHRFPDGWVNSTNLFEGDLVVEAWLPSVSYFAPLGLYLMAASGTGCAPDGTEFGKPSYLGLWTSPSPWGPWNQIHEETAWTPDGDAAACAYAPQILPKWIAPDGRSFWLAWADLQGMRDFVRDRAELGERMSRASNHQERSRVLAEFHKEKLPYYALNAQKVELEFPGS